MHDDTPDTEVGAAAVKEELLKRVPAPLLQENGREVLAKFTF